MADCSEETLRLSEIFEEVFTYVRKIDNQPSDDSARCDEIIKLAENLMKMINELDLFSNNEELDEVATGDLRYFLLPAFLAALLDFRSRNTIDTRRVDLLRAKTMIIDFLRLCASYSLLPPMKLNDFLLDDDKSVRIATRSRENKIALFKEKKALDAYFEAVGASASASANEDDQREYYIKLLEFWRSKSMSELPLILDEIDVLAHRADLVEGRVETAPEIKAGPIDPMLSRPFIITKNALMKSVYGAGYTNLPIYTIEEWYDKCSKEGRTPVLQGGSSTATGNVERRGDSDEEAERQRAMRFDEVKDNVRRGDYNRFKKG